MKLKEIAELMHVSPATVSLVMKNRPGVGPEKRRQILAVLRDNGYIADGGDEKPPRSVRFIKYYRHSHLVNGNPGFVNRIIEALERECRDRGIDFLVTTVNATAVDEAYITGLLQNETADGVIFLGTELRPEDMHILNACTKPLIVVDNPMENTSFSCVTMDNAAAVRSAVRYLAETGRTDPGFLANAEPACNCDVRRRAFCSAVTELGWSPEGRIWNVTPSPETACDDVTALLEQGVKFPSALVCNNDCIALGALKAFRQAGIRVPEDIALIGFDNIEYAALSSPGLSTVDVSCKTMGIVAMQLLLARLANPTLPGIKSCIDTRLVLRETC